MNKEQSEFGKGLVVCLIKFSSHFSNDLAKNLMILRNYQESNDKQKKLMLQQNPPDYINYGKYFHEQLRFMINQLLPIHDNNLEEFVSSQIELWANGASDHLYEIEVPKGKGWTYINEKVKDLQNKGLQMGHGFDKQKLYTFEDWDELKKLTNEISILIDNKIGLNPDTGEYD